MSTQVPPTTAGTTPGEQTLPTKAAPELMSGIRVIQHEPHVVVDLPKPVIDINSAQVLIKVHAAGVNPTDWKAARGDFVPLVNVPEVPGYDVSGTVEAVGAQAQAQWKVGDQVWGDIAPRSGSYSQYVIADSTNIDHKPRNISFQEAAAIPLAGLTAFQALVRLGHLKAGQKVLVLGGSSGVGNYAIQIAKAIGATVWATAGQDHIELVKRAGADVVINYQTQKFVDVLAGAKMDLVFDVVGIKEDRDAAFDITAHHGHLITTQPMEPKDKPSFLHILKASANYAWDKTASALWRDVHYHFLVVDATTASYDLPTLRAWVEENKLKANIVEVFPLAKVKDAWTKSQTLHPGGKIVLEVAKEPSA